MNHQIPSVDQFLASSEPDEDDGPTFGGYVGVIHNLPPDPMERVATALEDIVNHFMADKQPAPLYGDVHVHSSDEAPHTWARKAAESAEEVQTLTEEIADLRADRAELAEVVDRIEAALGKSKAAPALAAKAVIEAWRNPQVPEPVEPSLESMDNHANHLPSGVECTDACPRSEPEPSGITVTYSEDSVEGHTRTPHPEGADFCRECSGALQEWIVWPCPTVSGEAQPLATGPEEGHEQPVQPEHNAPVEEWREYARALGYAGPEIDKANRSMIRTTLGIAQVPAADISEGDR